MTQPIDRWCWLQLCASEHGPSDPSTRHVLMVLALHMSAEGDHAWPSQVLLARRSGLSERSVRRHLDNAQATGWLVISRRKRTGQAWYVNQYEACIPDQLMEFIPERPWEQDPEWVRPDKLSARTGDDRRTSTTQRADSGAQRPDTMSATTGQKRHDDRSGCPTNSSSKSSENLSKKIPQEGALTRTDVVRDLERIAEEVQQGRASTARRIVTPRDIATLKAAGFESTHDMARALRAPLASIEAALAEAP